MSVLLNPKGPETPATYWRRRAAVVAVALLVLALLWWLISLFTGPGGKAATVSAVPQNTPTLATGGSSSPSPSASASASASTSPSASTSQSAQPSASASSSSAKPSATPTPTPTGPVACDPGKLTLKLDGDRRPKIGQPTTWKVLLTSQDGDECTLDLAKNPLALHVASGSDEIWSTDDCANWAPDKPITLAKGSGEVVVSWPLQRSGKGCKLVKEELRAGTYVATASLGQASARLVMMLHF